MLKVAVGEVVGRAGRRDDLFYVVLRGELYTLDSRGDPVPGGELHEGDSFGQVAALQAAPTTTAGAAHSAADAAAEVRVSPQPFRDGVWDAAP